MSNAAEIVAKTIWESRGDHRQCAGEVIDALKANGLVIRPVEPTEAMLKAGGLALFIQGRGGEIQAGRLYNAMNKAMIAEEGK